MRVFFLNMFTFQIFPRSNRIPPHNDLLTPGAAIRPYHRSEVSAGLIDGYYVYQIIHAPSKTTSVGGLLPAYGTPLEEEGTSNACRCVMARKEIGENRIEETISAVVDRSLLDQLNVVRSIFGISVEKQLFENVIFATLREYEVVIVPNDRENVAVCDRNIELSKLVYK